jgi:hypothetical protein
VTAVHLGLTADRKMRAEHELANHNDIGCPIYDCRVRFDATEKGRMDKHRATHHLFRQFGLPEPKGWTEAPQLNILQAVNCIQGNSSPLQVGAESDSAPTTGAIGGENIENVP